MLRYCPIRHYLSMHAREKSRSKIKMPKKYRGRGRKSEDQDRKDKRKEEKLKEFLSEEELKNRIKIWEDIMVKFSFEESEEDGVLQDDFEKLYEKEQPFDDFVYNPLDEAQKDLTIEGAELFSTSENTVALIPEQQYQNLVAQFEPGYVDMMIDLFRERESQAEELIPLCNIRFERTVQEDFQFEEQQRTPHMTKNTRGSGHRVDHSVLSFDSVNSTFKVPAPVPRNQNAPAISKTNQKQSNFEQLSLQLPESIQRLLDSSNFKISVTERTIDIQIQQRSISFVPPLVHKDSTIKTESSQIDQNEVEIIAAVHISNAPTEAVRKPEDPVTKTVPQLTSRKNKIYYSSDSEDDDMVFFVPSVKKK